MGPRLLRHRRAGESRGAAARPERPRHRAPALVEDLRQRGLRTPLLLRFSDILAARVRRLADAFLTAAAEYGYKGKFRGVYPIKVNQQRPVVEEIVAFGAEFGIGLEAGSKPELLIALALLDTPDALIICNGYKDRAYIETALLAQRLGRRPVIVIDRFHELDLVIKASRASSASGRTSACARGSRPRAPASGSTRPATSRSSACRRRRSSRPSSGCARRTCSSASSCCTSTSARRSPRSAPSRTRCARPRASSPACSRSARSRASSTSAAASAWTTTARRRTSTRRRTTPCRSTRTTWWRRSRRAATRSACPHPDIVTEAGRWMVAHHSMIVFDILGVNEVRSGKKKLEPVGEDDPKVLRDLAEVWEGDQPEDGDRVLPRRAPAEGGRGHAVQRRPARPAARARASSACSGTAARRSSASPPS